jgi:SAM-dependent methyltransferase
VAFAAQLAAATASGSSSSVQPATVPAACTITQPEQVGTNTTAPNRRDDAGGSRRLASCAPGAQSVRVEELAVPAELCRNAIGDPEAVVDAAVWLIGHMCEHIGANDLGGLDVLDFGCGVRFTQAFLSRGVPIKAYVGVDVSREVIDFLRANVSDPRFAFFHLGARNELYNPTGRPLSEMAVPEIEGRHFDLICLFSVFTHLAPPDYVAMLRLLRRFVRPNGRLFYTLFINELTDGGYGYVDQLSKQLATSDDPQVKQALATHAATSDEPPDFKDENPSKPLMVALYSRRHAVELITDTGWELLSVSPPDIHLQHHIVCAPSA